ncbi:MAG TPA: single-stranded-DNA-specific exonuclease RecJ [Clostridiales bacterium]|nr:single-stranded-DNA-specific exonuclease RecJ [Clostridiales bacterium]
MRIKRWVIPPLEKELAAQLSEECEINPFLALLLVTRGIADAESAAEFLLGGDIQDDPYSFADMDIAVERIQRAIDSRELTAVYGDYDVDGVTATVLLYSYLREKGADVIYYIPERECEGYGLNRQSIDYLHQQGVKLIITVDNGISAIDEIDYAAEKGIDVVVTDHHQPPEKLPNALAVVNPKRLDCESQFKEYAGVGVAFKLVCALEGDTDTVIEKYGDLVALGTLGDVMLLKGENRTLVREGLKVLNNNLRPGINALRKLAGIENKYIDSITTVFSLVPRLNAAGRMDTPDLAARLLLTNQDIVAETLASELQECNVKRKEVEDKILEDASRQIQSDPGLLAARVLVIEGQDWHPGVIGIIAAKIADRYGKPCILLSTKDGETKGSGRSIKGFSLYEAVSACSDLLLRFGGHDQAAGITLSPGKVGEFRERINRFAAEKYPVMPVPEIRIDFKIRPSQVDIEKLNLISALEPLGTGNPQPVFGLFGMRLDNIMPIGQGRHLRLSVSRDNVRLSVCRYNATCETFPFECGQIVNLVVTMERNEYRGVVTPSLQLKDIRLADVQQEELILALDTYDKIMRLEDLSSSEAALYKPERPEIERIYRFLRSKRKWVGNLEQLAYLLQQPAISYIRLFVSLEVLRQAGLISMIDRGDLLEVSVLPVKEKADLNKTPIMQHLNSCLLK